MVIFNLHYFFLPQSLLLLLRILRRSHRHLLHLQFLRQLLQYKNKIVKQFLDAIFNINK